MDSRRARPLLGTIVEVAARCASARDTNNATARAFAAIEKVQRLMSAHDPASDVGRVNRWASRREVPVHPWTHRVLRAALALSGECDGAFDVTVGATLARWGYLPDDGANLVLQRGRRGTSPRPTGAIHRRGSFRDVELTASGVRLHAPLMLDLGGIAKGFAVDMAIASVARFSPDRIVVNAGGDLRVAGRLGAAVGISDPASPSRVAATVRLENASIATSAAYRTRARRGGHWHSHIVDPRTDRPYLGFASLSVIAGRCMLADALTKAVLLGAPRRVLRRHRASALLVFPGGRVSEAGA